MPKTLPVSSHATLAEISCQYLKGVGPRLAALLAKCQIFTVQDILFHLPYRYQDRTRITPIRYARVGEWVVVQGTVTDYQNKRGKKRNIQQFIYALTDNTGTLTLRFFHLHPTQQAKLKVGAVIQCFGEIRFGNEGLTLIHPEYQYLQDPLVLPEKNLTPIYPSTEGLTQTIWRNIIAQALLRLSSHTLIDYLPTNLTASLQLWTLNDALLYVHAPPANANIIELEQRRHPAQLRLAFEELLAHHLILRLRRDHIKKNCAPQIQPNHELQQRFMQQLVFSLTGAQQRVATEILADLQQPHPMLRLIQGDVGSGKTVIAALSALHVVANGYQVALMAPTEILAEQHFQQFYHWCKPLDMHVTLLNGQLTSIQKKHSLEKIATHETHIIIGTHALFQKSVVFAKLGLIIIDEQHRFGVEQRLALKEKGEHPHQLIMTATPIPRTLAMTFYADLNLSIIDELPPGRTPIKTVLINANRRHEIMQRVAHACAENRQIYWVCPLIEESEALQCQATEKTAQQLRQKFPQLQIGLIHGRLKSSDKENVMQAFKSGALNILVATTVIEVGVDVPNASVMIIENAERLGLAQLHQLRGRVGRGNIASFCLLLYQEPLSQIAHQRLRAMRQYQDGFKIAEEDLSLRGPGELLGTRQTGLLSLRIADLQRDQALFPAIQHCADQLLHHYPTHVSALIARWLGENTKFQTV